MFERDDDREEGPEPTVGTVPTLAHFVESVHHAAFLRANELRKEIPGARVEQTLIDNEPRAILIVIASDGSVLWKEFVETAYSADRTERNEEYIDAARAHHRLALHYPSQMITEDDLIRRISDLWVKIRQHGITEEVIIDGFLFDLSGNTVLSV